MVQILNNLLQKLDTYLESKVEASTYNTKEQMKGLTQFIMDIRLCKSREAEIKRINKELANIRNKFRSDKNIDGYHKKKYVAKLIFIFLLGYDVNIGQSEAMFLLSSTKQSEKQIGYLFLSLLFNHNDCDYNDILINCLLSDLRSVNYYNIMLAANCIPFFMSDELVKELGPTLHDLLINTPPDNSEYQSFLTCYLAFIKYDKQYFLKNPNIISCIIKMYPTATDIMVLPLTNVVYEGALISPDSYSQLYSVVIDHISKLCKISINSPQSYYNIISPWTILKMLQLLQILNCTSQHTASLSKLLLHIYSMENPAPNIAPHKKIHYSNIVNALKFEAVNVAANTSVTEECINYTYAFLSKMLDSPETNYRFLSLESLMRMKYTPSFNARIKEFSNKLSYMIASEKNSSLRLQAVTVIYSIGDLSNSKEIVENMVKFLAQSEFCIREELTLKICTIASKNICDAKWYIDTMISLLIHGRETTGEEVWFKVAHTISNHKDIQLYATKTLATHLNYPNSPENIVKLGVYVLGEYGHLICHEASYNSHYQYTLIIGLFPFHSTSTKVIILTALSKMAFNQPTLKQQIISFFNNSMVTQNIDNELQQRACEYGQLLTKDDSILSNVLCEFPPYECIESDDEDDGNFINDNTMSNSTDLLASEDTTTVRNDTNQQINHDSSGRETSFLHSGSQVANIPFLKNFASSNKGILYEDHSIIVKLASVYNKSLGSHELIFESVDPYIHIKILSYAQKSSEDGVTLSTFNADSMRTFSGGCLLTIQSICLCPFSTNPIIAISYIASNSPHQKSIALVLPISVFNYMQPYTIATSSFINTWNCMSGPELEKIEIFEASKVYNSNDIQNKLNLLNMQIIAGIDPNPSNFVSASAFYSQNLVGGCITRIETKPDSATMRLTVRSNLPDLTKVVSKCMISSL